MNDLQDKLESDALRDSVIRRMSETPPKHKPKATARQDARKAQTSSVTTIPLDPKPTQPIIGQEKSKKVPPQ